MAEELVKEVLEKQKTLGDIGFKDTPSFVLSFKQNDKFVRVGIYKNKEGKEGYVRKLPVTIPAGTYINLFVVDPVKYKEFAKTKMRP